MKIAYHQPALTTLSAHRIIYFGYQNAFADLGHEFLTFSAGMDLEHFLKKYQPDIFISASHFFWRKQLDFQILKKYREQGMVVITKLDFWDSPLASGRINEAKSMKSDKEAVSLIKRGLLGDIYFHVVEQGDRRMEGFTQATGYDYQTIPLAADKTLMRPNYDETFDADISFLGTNLPQKRLYFKEWLLPLGNKYDLKLYGQDWTLADRTLGRVQKIGQYFNMPVLKTIRKPKLQLEDEARIYSSSRICVNLHEDYQREFGGDCNERTFKIPACGALEIVDNVACIKTYLEEGKEVVIAYNKQDWFDKIKYYMDYPDKAQKIAKQGMHKVLSQHTYHNRASQILALKKDHK